MAQGSSQKKTETRWKIVGVAKMLTMSWQGHDVDVFAKGIKKLNRNMSGDHRRKTVRLTTGDSEEIPMGKPPVSNGSTGTVQDFRWLSATELPRLGG
ncbi:hypothetical protein BHM03_00061351 [Ensete ventricosum]|nr:hypothetical protein BHM03_00061351 [Ensete ventricosum]